MGNAEKKQTIMIVEDDSFVMDIYKTKLSQEGFSVVEAENGAEAIKKLKDVKPDLMLLDIIMPYMDGLEVLKKIKETEEHQEYPCHFAHELEPERRS